MLLHTGKDVFIIIWACKLGWGTSCILVCNSVYHTKKHPDSHFITVRADTHTIHFCAEGVISFLCLTVKPTKPIQKPQRSLSKLQVCLLLFLKRQQWCLSTRKRSHTRMQKVQSSGPHSVTEWLYRPQHAKGQWGTVCDVTVIQDTAKGALSWTQIHRVVNR